MNKKITDLTAKGTLEDNDLFVVVDSGDTTTKKMTKQTVLDSVSNTTTGHDHDGSDSKKVVATNLDVTGLTASQLLRVNSGATAVESSGKTVPTGDIVGTSDSQTLTNKTLTSPVLNTSVSGTAVLDEDNMASDSATKVATQQSIKAYVDASIATAKLASNPVGSILTNITGTNPATYIGGTWVAFGSGRVPVGLDAGQTEFDTVEETGGAKTHTLVTAEMPVHSHTRPTRAVYVATGAGEVFDPNGVNAIASGNTGGGGAHNNLQPYIVVYMWKRSS